MTVRTLLVLGAALLSAACAENKPKALTTGVQGEAPASGDIALPFTAGGNEPGWHLEVNSEEMTLVTGYGESIRKMSLLGRDTYGDTTRFNAKSANGKAVVSVTATLCRDSATGMPYPYAVNVKTRDDTKSGCGGKPSSLLVGRVWVVESLDGRGTTESSTMTLAFDASGRVGGRASCNSYTAEYRLTGESLTIDLAAATKMACPDALMRQEQRFFEILEGIDRFDLDESGALILTGNAGSLMAR